MSAEQTQELVHSLVLAQQPKRAQAMNTGGREKRPDKRPVDPPPVIRLQITRPDGTEDLESFLNRQLVMHVALFSEDGTVEHTVARTAGGAEGMPALSIDELGEGVAFGTLVSHAHYARDVEDRLGCFFCFPDIRVRYPGRFRLRFQVFELPNPAHEGAESTALTHILSEPFRVYGSKDFPGVDSSTRLTRVLSSQIVGIPVHNKSRLKYEDDNAEQDD